MEAADSQPPALPEPVAEGLQPGDVAEASMQKAVETHGPDSMRVYEADYRSAFYGDELDSDMELNGPPTPDKVPQDGQRRQAAKDS